MNYDKERQDLHNKVDFENSLSEGDLINLIIEVRKQRDEYKDLCFEYKSMLDKFESKINSIKKI